MEIASCDDRVKYCCHPHNIGMMENFAFGIDRVDTPYFNILSDDDVLLPAFFATGMKGLREHPQARLFAGLMIVVDGEGNVRRAPQMGWRPGLLHPPEAFQNVIRRSTASTWTSMIFDSRIIRELGGLDLSIGTSADLDFELKAAIRYPAVVSHEPCAIFVGHAKSVSAADWVAKLAAAAPRLLENVRSMIQEAQRQYGLSRKGAEIASSTVLSELRRSLFQGALGAATRDNRSAAEMAAVALCDPLDARTRAWLIRFIAGGSPFAAPLRVLLGMLLIWRANRQIDRYRGKYGDMAAVALGA